MALPVSIDTMKSTINRRGGLARGNRYAVYITHPSKSINSLLGYNPATLLSNLISGDGVNIADFITDPRDMFLLCQTAMMPGKRILTQEAMHNHHMSKKPYSAATDEVSMSFLLTNDYYIKKYFDMWQEMIIDTSGRHYKAFYKQDYCTDVLIQQLSPSNDVIPGYTIKLTNAYPITVSQIDLSEGADGLTSVSVTFEYDNFESLSLTDGWEDLSNKMLQIGANTLDIFKRVF